MSDNADRTKISMGVWEIARHPDQNDRRLAGKPFGLRLYGSDEELQGEDFLTREEALELRDFITTRFGE